VYENTVNGRDEVVNIVNHSTTQHKQHEPSRRQLERGRTPNGRPRGDCGRIESSIEASRRSYFLSLYVRWFQRHPPLEPVKQQEAARNQRGANARWTTSSSSWPMLELVKSIFHQNDPSLCWMEAGMAPWTARQNFSGARAVSARLSTNLAYSAIWKIVINCAGLLAFRACPTGNRLFSSWTEQAVLYCL
jgi:hypothetical protein